MGLECDRNRLWIGRIIHVVIGSADYFGFLCRIQVLCFQDFRQTPSWQKQMKRHSC